MAVRIPEGKKKKNLFAKITCKQKSTAAGGGEGEREKEQEGVWEDLWALDALERHVTGVF